MTVLRRLSAALYAAATAFLPAVALAQGAGGADPAPAGRNYGWVWMLAAALVIVALFRMFFGRSRKTTPPAHRP